MTVPDLEAITAEFLPVCGPCDLGVPAKCVCSQRDHRPAMFELVQEIRRLRETLEDLAKDSESFPEVHPWSRWGSATATRLRLILAGERP